MIGRALGELAEALTTGVFAGFFTNWFPKIWKGLAEGASHPVVKDYLEKRVVSAKGLKNNSVFAYLLATSGFTPDKKKQIVNAMNMVETLSKKYAENFRLIIAMDEIGDGKITVKAKNGTVTTSADPNYVRPGMSILKQLAACTTETEMIAAIMAMGAFNEAPDGTLDEIKIWAKKVALPNTLAFLNSAATKLGDGIFSVTGYVHQQYEDRRNRATVRMIRRQQNFFNWFNPALWIQWFMDLR